MTYAEQIRAVAASLAAERDDPSELPMLAPMLALRLEEIAVGVQRQGVTLDEMTVEAREQAEIDARIVVEVPPPPVARRRVHLRVVG